MYATGLDSRSAGNSSKGNGIDRGNIHGLLSETGQRHNICINKQGHGAYVKSIHRLADLAHYLNPESSLTGSDVWPLGGPQNRTVGCIIQGFFLYRSIGYNDLTGFGINTELAKSQSPFNNRIKLTIGLYPCRVYIKNTALKGGKHNITGAAKFNAGPDFDISCLCREPDIAAACRNRVIKYNTGSISGSEQCNLASGSIDSGSGITDDDLTVSFNYYSAGTCLLNCMDDQAV